MFSQRCFILLQENRLNAKKILIKRPRGKSAAGREDVQNFFIFHFFIASFLRYSFQSSFNLLYEWLSEGPAN